MADDMEFRCFIGGLSWSTSDKGLREAFEKFGRLTEAKNVDRLPDYLEDTIEAAYKRLYLAYHRMLLDPDRGIFEERKSGETRSVNGSIALFTDLNILLNPGLHWNVVANFGIPLLILPRFSRLYSTFETSPLEPGKTRSLLLGGCVLAGGVVIPGVQLLGGSSSRSQEF
ncbi:hypothetical protein J5N97_012134 [Dioscorea zingiberensis]|uniref:RRM domain-containing protein n=1 Tax=Dioscorea zingiberensis TaxID=325984 RepID=A0A9D5CQX3_9LILI|nr:hypothetical protein J5N97_012134 [Dioscorea zingiberensis]